HFDNLLKRVARVGFVAKHAQDDPALMHARRAFHQTHVKGALQFNGVEAGRRFERGWQRLPDVRLAHRPVTKQQLLFFRPHLKPGGEPRKAFFPVSALDQPPNLPRGVGVELRLDQIEINPQLAVEFGGQPMLDDFVNQGGEHRQPDGCCRRIPEREAEFERAAFPPVAHPGASSRSTKPTPRMVWMSFTCWPSSILRRRWATWTSITLSSGVARCGSRQTSLASICRVTVWP